MDNKQPENFRQLILRLKGDKTYETIEKMAGGTPSSRGLQKLVTRGFTRMPDPETVRGLSLALNVSQREIVLAAARTLGIDVESESPNDLLLVGAGRLPQRSQDVLVSMSREMQYLRQQPLSHEEEKRDNDDLVRSIHRGDFNERDETERHLDGIDQLAADKGDPNVDPEQLPED